MASGESPGLSCAELEVELIDSSLGEALPPSVQQHLEQCARCQRALNSHRVIWGAVASLPMVRAALDVRGRVLVAASSAVQGDLQEAVPESRRFGDIPDSFVPTEESGSLWFNQNLTADQRPTRDVKAHVLHAAGALLAGIAPPSVEGFKNVATGASNQLAPSTFGNRQSWPRRKWRLLVLAAITMATAGALALLWQVGGSSPSPNSEANKPSVVVRAQSGASLPEPSLEPKVSAAVPAPSVAAVEQRSTPTGDAAGESTHTSVVKEEQAVVSPHEGEPASDTSAERAPRETNPVPPQGEAAEGTSTPAPVYLAINLQKSSDLRLRAQSASLLGDTQSPAAVSPLCEAMHDPEVPVRVAVARALGRLGYPSALRCLKDFHDPVPEVQTEVDGAIQVLTQPHQAPVALVSIERIAIERNAVAPDQALFFGTLVRDSLGKRGVGLLTEAADAGTPTAPGGPPCYRLSLILSPNGATGLKLELTVWRCAVASLVGSFNVKARNGGGTPEARERMLKVMLERLLSDVGDELKW